MTLLRDKIWQALYTVAYHVFGVFCFIFRPAVRAVNIAVWHADTVLIIKNAYHPQFTLPGGHVGHGETERAAAVRELQEEVHLRVSPKQLRRVARLQRMIRYKRETLTLFESQIAPFAMVKADNREVIWAEFLTISEALDLNLASHVRAYLQSVDPT